MESMVDQARVMVSGQLTEMKWALAVNVPVPMCPFVAADLRRDRKQSDLVVAA